MITIHHATVEIAITESEFWACPKHRDRGDPTAYRRVVMQTQTLTMETDGIPQRFSWEAEVSPGLVAVLADGEQCEELGLARLRFIFVGEVSIQNREQEVVEQTVRAMFPGPVRFECPVTVARKHERIPTFMSDICPEDRPVGAPVGIEWDD